MKKIDFFFKNVKDVKFAVECLSIDIISQKCLFHLNSEVFAKKYQKFIEFGKKWKNI